MKKKFRKITAVVLALILTLSLSVSVFAAGPGGFGGGSSSPTFSGATVISKSVTKSGTKYSSSTGSQNALLASGGTSTLKSITVNKSGNSSDENSDFYGTNAAVLAYNGATLNISDATISTSGTHANAVFAYGEGVINISDSTIKTTANNSGAVMVTGGGTLTATNVTAETDGNSSAPIRSDRGGGTLNVNGGSYTANGQGSPAIYSTADITVNGATLNSTSAEGVVIEGKNSVTLNNTTLTDNNVTLNGNSETYKNIFIYQSMSGDADEGVGSFTASDSAITTNNGDSFFVTNTTAVINLTNNEIVNNDKSGAFLRIQSGKWGNSGSNGGIVTLNADNQVIDGDIIVDNISALTISLTNGSTYSGVINSSNSAKSVTLKLDSSSTLTLEGDCYITGLENEVSDNSNINLNGHTLYVNGKAITSTSYSGSEEEANTSVETIGADNTAEASTENESKPFTAVIIAVIAVAVVLVVIAVVIILLRKRKQSQINNQ